MHVQRTCLLLALTTLSVFADEPVQDNTRSINLQPIRPGDANHDGNDFLQVKATFTIERTSMVSVDRMEFYLYPVGGEGGYQMLAVAENASTGFSVRFGWQNICPSMSNLYTQWPQEEVKMLGTFGAGADSTSFAQLNWLTDKSGYCFIYKVVVIGQDNQGQSVSIYRTYKLKADDGCKARPTTKDIVEALIEENNVCLATAPNVQSQANQINTEVQRAQNVSDLASETSSNRNKLENSNNLILAFQPTLEALSNNQDEITRQSETIDSLNSSLIDGYASKFQEIENMLKKIDVHEKATTVLESVPATSVSSIYEDAVYIIRQQTGSMDLSSMAADCRGLNGILLEFEGWYEQQFVGSFLNLKNLEPAFTGANDVVEEGRYVYYQSGNPVGSVVWNSDEPDNSTTENCVGLFQSGKLSDLSCDTNAKFICKISLIKI